MNILKTGRRNKITIQLSKPESILVTIQAINFGNKKYLTVNQMAAVTNKSTQTIYSLIKKGNVIRKMKHIKVVDRLLIPFSGLTEYPFTSCGPKSKETIYHYDETGRVIE